MSEPAAPTPAPAETDPVALHGADAVSGARFQRWNLAALLIGLVALGGGLAVSRSSPGASPETVAWHDPLGVLRDATWDDGLAEVAHYQAQRTLYGQVQRYDLVRIAVKETHDPTTGTKPERPTPTMIDAIKTVASHDVPTQRAYDYHQQVICRLGRTDARRLLDATLVSAEWCGSTFALLRQGDDGLRREVRSYWEGEGDRTDSLPAGTWLEDQLPFTLRTLDLSQPLQVELLPAVLSNRAPASQPRTATIKRAAEDAEVTVPAGTFRCDHVVVEVGEQTWHYWISRADVRLLIKFEDATGSGELERVERTAYWEG